jgi:hypothetical protein
VVAQENKQTGGVERKRRRTERGGGAEEAEEAEEADGVRGEDASMREIETDGWTEERR